jgi:hypothetical protein
MQKKTAPMSWEEFSRHMGEKLSFEGGVKGIEEAYHFMNSYEGNTWEFIGELCLTFVQKPTRFMLLGTTASGKGDGKVLDREVAQFLPMLTEEEIEAMRETPQYTAFVKARRGYPEHVKNINLTRVRVIGLLYAELTSISETSKPALVNFHRNNLKKPSELTDRDHFYTTIGGDFAQQIRSNRRALIARIVRFIRENNIEDFH